MHFNIILPYNPGFANDLLARGFQTNTYSFLITPGPVRVTRLTAKFTRSWHWVAIAAGVAEVGPNYYNFSSCYSFSPTESIVIQPVTELLGRNPNLHVCVQEDWMLDHIQNSWIQFTLWIDLFKLLFHIRSYLLSMARYLHTIMLMPD